MTISKQKIHTDVLVIAAHPDDAELGAGGFISYLSALGKQVTIVNFTVSEIDESARERRILAANQAAKILNVNLDWANEKKLDQVEDLPEYACVKEIDRLMDLYSPKIIITHTDTDSHGDHIRLSRAVIASSRRWDADIIAFQPNEYRTSNYQTFQPNFFIDISDYIDTKCDAISCYNYNSMNFRNLHTDAIRTLDKARGTQCGYAYAEGFKIIRKKGIGF